MVFVLQVVVDEPLLLVAENLALDGILELSDSDAVLGLHGVPSLSLAHIVSGPFVYSHVWHLPW